MRTILLTAVYIWITGWRWCRIPSWCPTDCTYSISRLQAIVNCPFVSIARIVTNRDAISIRARNCIDSPDYQFKNILLWVWRIRISMPISFAMSQLPLLSCRTIIAKQKYAKFACKAKAKTKTTTITIIIIIYANAPLVYVAL